MVFFLNQKGVAKGGMPSCEKERLCLCRAERWSYTGTAWLRKGQCDGCLLGGSRKSESTAEGGTVGRSSVAAVDDVSKRRRSAFGQVF